MRNTLNIYIKENNKMAPVIRIPDELYQRLEGLAVGFDTPANVIEKLLDQQGVGKVSKQDFRSSRNPNPAQQDLPASEFKKLHRIKGWATKNPRPDVGRVVQKYIDLTTDNAGIDRDIFIKELQTDGVYDGDYSKIENNLAQMKGDTGNQHGKVFLELAGRLVMYDVAYEEVLKYFSKRT